MKKTITKLRMQIGLLINKIMEVDKNIFIKTIIDY